MKNVIGSWQAFIVLGFIIAVVMGARAAILMGVDEVRGTATVVAEGPCVFTAWSLGDRNQTRLNLSCNGNQGWTEDGGFISSYLTKPGPLVCSVRRSGEADCK